MGLVLYSILFFFGARGVPVRTGLAYCLATAAILTPPGLAAIDDMPPCLGTGCNYSPPTLAAVGVLTVIMALASFGAGIAARRLSMMMSRKRA